jgi:hypothetical protein
LQTSRWERGCSSRSVKPSDMIYRPSWGIIDCPRTLRQAGVLAAARRRCSAPATTPIDLGGTVSSGHAICRGGARARAAPRSVILPHFGRALPPARAARDVPPSEPRALHAPASLPRVPATMLSFGGAPVTPAIVIPFVVVSSCLASAAAVAGQAYGYSSAGWNAPNGAAVFSAGPAPDPEHDVSGPRRAGRRDHRGNADAPLSQAGRRRRDPAGLPPMASPRRAGPDRYGSSGNERSSRRSSSPTRTSGD